MSLMTGLLQLGTLCLDAKVTPQEDGRGHQVLAKAVYIWSIYIGGLMIVKDSIAQIIEYSSHLKQNKE